MTIRNGDMPDYPLVKVEDIIIQNWDSRPLYQQGGFGFHMSRGVKITHVPSRLAVECDKERSQHKNKHLALLELNTLLAELDKAVGE